MTLSTILVFLVIAGAVVAVLMAVGFLFSIVWWLAKWILVLGVIAAIILLIQHVFCKGRVANMSPLDEARYMFNKARHDARERLNKWRR